MERKKEQAKVLSQEMLADGIYWELFEFSHSRYDRA